MPAVQYSDDNLRALANHPKRIRNWVVPRNKPIAPGAVIEAVTQALFPWEQRFDYPGRIRGLVTLFRGRVTKWAIREWRRGRNPTPQWALDLVLTELHKRRAALDHAIALIEAHNKKPAD